MHPSSRSLWHAVEEIKRKEKRRFKSLRLNKRRTMNPPRITRKKEGTLENPSMHKEKFKMKKKKKNVFEKVAKYAINRGEL